MFLLAALHFLANNMKTSCFPTYATRGSSPLLVGGNMAAPGQLVYNVHVFCRIDVKEENYNSQSVFIKVYNTVQEDSHVWIKTVQVRASDDLVCTARVC